MNTIKISSGKTFKALANDTILESAEKNKINLPYSCRIGRCSTCKCKVLTGETYTNSSDAAISQAEREAGWVLSCVTYAKSDLEVQVRTLEHKDLVIPKIFPCKITKIEYLSIDLMRVNLRTPPNNRFYCIPGQYINIMLEGEIARSYSVANSTKSSSSIELHIKRFDGGLMSDYWFNRAKEDDFLRFKGPFGTFFLDEVEDKRLVFLATGTGIAPVKAILEGINERHKSDYPKSVEVYWGSRKPSDLYFEIPEVDYPLSFEKIISQPSSGWLGKIDYVQNVFLNTKPDLDDVIVYACGSESMIKDSRDLLIKSGLPSDSFFSDAFVKSGQ